MKLYIPLLRANRMTIQGTPRYIGVNVKFDDFNQITLSDRVVISNGCILLTHDYSYTTAMLAVDESVKSDIALVRPITIGENVFIGKNTIVMPNTKIGKNVIVGAGSVVRGILLNDSVYIGNPAKNIGNIGDVASKWKEIDSNTLRVD